MQVKLVAVTKNRTPAEILNLPSGITDIAESKLQEALPKLETIENQRKFKKHFIGKLQKNKLKKIVTHFDTIQTADSFEIIEKINFHAKQLNKIQEIFLQINISNDPLKNGLNPTQTLTIVNQASNLPNIHLNGLMTILKNNLSQDQTIKHYTDMKILFNEINKTILIAKPLTYLSMGMSDDWESAIKAGSNMLRIGTALFEKNHQKNFLKYV